jgi:hypothetical protein
MHDGEDMNGINKISLSLSLLYEELIYFNDALSSF